MKCNLDKYEKYELTKAVHNDSDGGYMLTLAAPPKDCPDGKFLTHRAKITVAPGAPTMGYNSLDNVVTIQVPSQDYIQELEHISTGRHLAIWGAGIGIAVLFYVGIKKLFEDTSAARRRYEKKQEELREEYRSVSRRSQVGPFPRYRESRQSDPAPSPVTTAVAAGAGAFAGTLAADSLSERRRKAREEAETPSYTPTYMAPEPSYSKADDDEKPSRSYSSDSGSSYSSDSGSSYSSDSGSSYSSDSGSSFSSDSGSSFSSD